MSRSYGKDKKQPGVIAFQAAFSTTNGLNYTSKRHNLLVFRDALIAGASPSHYHDDKFRGSPYVGYSPRIWR
ncbi:hypothetical protein JCM10914A_46720 [Paenibacillus sp. JCM 10914]